MSATPKPPCSDGPMYWDWQEKYLPVRFIIYHDDGAYTYYEQRLNGYCMRDSRRISRMEFERVKAEWQEGMLKGARVL